MERAHWPLLPTGSKRLGRQGETPAQDETRESPRRSPRSSLRVDGGPGPPQQASLLIGHKPPSGAGNGDDGRNGGTDTPSGGDRGRPGAAAFPDSEAGPSATAEGDGSLPFTGLAIGALVAAGLALLTFGVASRRKTRGPGF